MERHAPIAIEMCVLPSLSVAASVLPSYSRRGEYVLSLEATNYRTSGDEGGGNRHLRIHKVSRREEEELVIRSAAQKRLKAVSLMGASTQSY